jgi:hypothetical protein
MMGNHALSDSLASGAGAATSATVGGGGGGVGGGGGGYTGAVQLDMSALQLDDGKHAAEEKYSDVIRDLTWNVLSNEPSMSHPDAAGMQLVGGDHGFLAINKQLLGRKGRLSFNADMAARSWKVIEQMCEWTGEHATGGKQIHRHCWDPKRQGDPAWQAMEQRRQIQAAKMCLEHDFKSEIKTKGGNAQSFIDDKYGKTSPEQMDWAHLYIHLREGDFNAADTVLTKRFNGHQGSIPLEEEGRHELRGAIEHMQRAQNPAEHDVGKPRCGEQLKRVFNNAEKAHNAAAKSPQRSRNFASLVQVVLNLDYRTNGGAQGNVYDAEFKDPYNDTYEWIWLKLAISNFDVGAKGSKTGDPPDKIRADNMTELRSVFWGKAEHTPEGYSMFKGKGMDKISVYIYTQILLLTGQFARVSHFSPLVSLSVAFSCLQLEQVCMFGRAGGGGSLPLHLLKWIPQCRLAICCRFLGAHLLVSLLL